MLDNVIEALLNREQQRIVAPLVLDVDVDVWPFFQEYFYEFGLPILDDCVQCRIAIVVLVVDDADVCFKNKSRDSFLSPLCGVVQRRLLRVVPEPHAGVVRE